jgi:tRNA pseudouridine55 synthase
MNDEIEGASGRDTHLGPGIVLVDKPVGITSAGVVEVLRRVTGIRRTGHGGTLDPFATGLLPVLVGREFTREADALLAGDKEYLLTVRFGSETDTCDLTGAVVARGPSPLPDEAAIRTALADFVGDIQQEAPAYSALKHHGRPLYWYARRGEPVVKPARTVSIRSADLVEWLPPDAVLRVSCGKGAYMRSLARDLGRVLGSCGHLVALRRTAIGPYRVEDATPLWRLERRATAPVLPATRLDLPKACGPRSGESPAPE